MFKNSYVKVCSFLLIMVFCLIFHYATTADPSGVWQPSADLGCVTGTACAEWDVGGQSLGVCCIDPVFIGSDDFSACSTGLRTP